MMICIITLRIGRPMYRKLLVCAYHNLTDCGTEECHYPQIYVKISCNDYRFVGYALPTVTPLSLVFSCPHESR